MYTNIIFKRSCNAHPLRQGISRASNQRQRKIVCYASHRHNGWQAKVTSSRVCQHQGQMRLAVATAFGSW